MHYKATQEKCITFGNIASKKLETSSCTGRKKSAKISILRAIAHKYRRTKGEFKLSAIVSLGFYFDDVESP